MPSPSVGHHHPVGHPRFSSAHHLPDSVPGGPQPPLRDENLNSGSRDRSPGRWHYTRRGLGPRIDPRSGGTVASIFALVATIYRTATHCEEASRLSLARRRERTTSRGTRRHSPGYCVPDCERVRVNGDAALRVLQRPPTWERGGPPAFAPAKVSMPNPARDPESADWRAVCARFYLSGTPTLQNSQSLDGNQSDPAGHVAGAGASTPATGRITASEAPAATTAAKMSGALAPWAL